MEPQPPEEMTHKQPSPDWTVDDVASYLKQKSLLKEANLCKEHLINGKYFNKETSEFLSFLHKGERIFEKNVGVPKIPSGKPKTINIPVHGHIKLHPLCIAIIDTPQFQRLRYLKQLGVTQFVYPGGVHTRFEHCLGVCHLAGELVMELKHNQPHLGINDADVLCVQIAGLCHDLGHGPFSHVFEKFMTYYEDNENPKKWAHEQTTVDLLDYMFKEPSNKLVTKFRDYNLKKEDYVFIREQIHPDPKTDEAWRFEGRPREKWFLYEIVSNARNGIDVDKWDYMARDCHHLGLTTSFDHNRFLRLARVIEDEKGEKQIGVREKEAFNAYEMFHMRHSLHRRVYQHRVTCAIEAMLVDALIKVEDIITIPNKDGKRIKINECTESKNMDAFTNLTDNIFHQILMGTEKTLNDDEQKKLKGAQDILQAIHRRDLYKCIFESSPLGSGTFKKKEIDAKKQFLDRLGDRKEEVHINSFHMQVASLNFGKKDMNPVDDLHFYTKEDDRKGKKLPAEKISHLIPRERYEEQIVRIFLNTSATDSDKELLIEASEILKERYSHDGNDVLPSTSQDEEM